MAQLTMQSSASAVDGYVERGGASEPWATLISSAGNAVDYTSSGFTMKLTANATTSLWTGVRRGIFLFDPSPLPPGSIITGGSISFYCNATTSRVFSSSFVLTNAPVTAYTSLITADYALLHAQPVEHGTARVTLASLVAGTRFAFTLNATALTTFQSLYDSGNVFELGLMFDWDFDEVSPTWQSGAVEDDVTVMTVESGSTKWPILTIEYYVGGGYANLELTCQKANAGDTCDADLFAVEVFSGT